jgi:hypothetical protein
VTTTRETKWEERSFFTRYILIFVPFSDGEFTVVSEQSSENSNMVKVNICELQLKVNSGGTALRFVLLLRSWNHCY